MTRRAESTSHLACWLVMPRAFTVVVLAAACGRGDPARAPAPPVREVGMPAGGGVVDGAIAGASDGAAAGPCPVATATLGPGLTHERWHVTRAVPAAGEPCIDVVRADPARYALRALTAEHGARPAPAWLRAFDLVAVINAGMFHDGGDPVGLVVADGAKPRGIDNPKFGGFIAWDPRTAGDPGVAMVGRGCGDRGAYRSYVQSYRLLDCEGGAIAWQDPKQYSAAAIGTDRTGRIVLVHARGAFTMRELSAELAAHDLAGAIFLEGGPEASLVVHGEHGSLERVGSYETNFVERDDNTAFWDLPNIIALTRR